LFGGAEGGRTRIELKRDGAVIPLATKTKMELRRGDVLTIHTAGGGGYGPPAGREGARIANDVRNGYVSAEAALAAYGRTG
jgi:N-methylhydantoinase B